MRLTVNSSGEGPFSLMKSRTAIADSMLANMLVVLVEYCSYACRRALPEVDVILKQRLNAYLLIQLFGRM